MNNTLRPLKGGWDCHVHVFDPKHPVQDGHYQPVLRSLPDIEHAAALQGMGHLVLVQPSVYGTDNQLLLNALAHGPGRHRGVVVVDTGVSDADLLGMHQLGVRGVRFNLVSPVGNGAAAFEALAPRLKPLGWHVQWYARADQLETINQLHKGTGLIPVLDHLAGLHAGIGPQDAAWQALERLSALGGWVKLSGWYRLKACEPYEALHGHIQRVAKVMGEHLVWGSDWPHTAFSPSDIPGYPSVWQPVAAALGPEQAATVAAAGAVLYA